MEQQKYIGIINNSGDYLLSFICKGFLSPALLQKWNYLVTLLSITSVLFWQLANESFIKHCSDVVEVLAAKKA